MAEVLGFIWTAPLVFDLFLPSPRKNSFLAHCVLPACVYRSRHSHSYLSKDDEQSENRKENCFCDVL